jgi:HEAT repeats
VHPPRSVGRTDCTTLVGTAILLVVLAGCQPQNPTVPLRDAGKSVAECRTMLNEADPELQARGALGLSLHGDAAGEAVPDLIPLLKSKNSLVRQNAALALGAIGPGAKAAVPALTEALKDPEWTVRRQAALALGAIGPDAKSAGRR